MTTASLARQGGGRYMLRAPRLEYVMPRMLSSLGLLPLLLLAVQGSATDETYATGVRAWQQEHDTDVRTGGWLLLVGRYEVGGGASSIGSDPDSTIVLPEGAPRRLGVLTRAGSVFQFAPASGVTATIDGAPAAASVELTTERGKGRLGAGNFSFVIRQIGDEFYALVQDSDNPAARNFRGTEWFPIDPAYRVRAQFVPYAQPQSVSVPMTHIESRTVMSSTGDVIFRLHGTQLRLRTFADGDQLFIMFRDRTNGRETYGGGRFLQAPLPQAGATTLDFNQAFNPFCAVNNYVLCPVVPAENRLSVSVAAGEKYRSAESH